MIRRIFGYEGELAYKNIKRNGSKGTVIAISIIAAVVMFLTITHVANGFERENAFEFNIPYDVMENYPPDIEIGGMAAYDKTNEIFKLVPKNTVAVFVPESRYFAAYADRIDEARLVEAVAVEADYPGEVYDELLAILEGGDYHNYSCGNLEERTQAYMATFPVIKTIMYGFTILITLIVIANLVNTISTGVILRRKEFAMLRSVGMTEKGLKRMLALETLLYGIRALVIGLPFSALLSFMFMKRANSSLKFELDIEIYAIVSASVFAIIALSMLFGAMKMRNDDIIDALKEDMC